MSEQPPERLDEEALRREFERRMADAAPPPTERAVPREGPDPRSRRSRRSGRGPRAASTGEDPHLHRGTVAAVEGHRVVVELGPRSHGVIALEEFDAPPEVGSEWEFELVHLEKDGLWRLSRRGARALATWRELDVGREVKAEIIGFNSGGLEAKVGPIAAFVPASEVALGRVEDLATLVGQTLVCKVVEADARRRRVVLSRRAVLERERREARERLLATLEPGAVVTGTVDRVERYGAFLDLGGGVTGLLHVSNLSHRRVEDATQALAPGTRLEVQVLEISEDGRRIALGRKQLERDPWEGIENRLQPGAVVTGTVARIAEFGVFVDVGDGVEGLLHRSQTGLERRKSLREAFEPGAEVLVRVLDVDPEKRRLSLSRLGERGGLLGSEEEAASEEEVSRYDERKRDRPFGTNLGDLLRRALGERNPPAE